MPQANGNVSPERFIESQPHRQSAVQIAIKNFSPVWFLISMDTGIISIIMNILPWQFDGLGIISTIMFVFNLVLFTVFTLLAITRLLTFPRHVKSESLNQVEEISYQGAPAIAYLTLVAQVALTCSTAWGFQLTVLAYVLWWIGLVWTVILCSASVIVLAKRSITDDRNLSPAIFLPLIAVMTLGTTGGILTRYSVGMSARLAIPMIVTSYMVIGYAFFLSLLYYAIYTHRLLAVGPPMKAKLPSLCVTIGPLGQFATAIQLLSTAANTRGLFGSYNRGTWLTASSASSVSAASELIALLVIGFGFLWITVAWYMIFEAAVQRKMPYSLTWWSMIFPMGVYTTALINLSISLNSDAFRGLAAALLIILVILYLMNWGFTLWRLLTGVALGIPQQREEEDEHAKEMAKKEHERLYGSGQGEREQDQQNGDNA
ncbi:malic acid transport [Stagonosporopsis vannaccii]|nr:malic acid transport [Stagonosporopsis vannaccii]